MSATPQTLVCQRLENRLHRSPLALHSSLTVIFYIPPSHNLGDDERMARVRLTVKPKNHAFKTVTASKPATFEEDEYEHSYDVLATWNQRMIWDHYKRGTLERGADGSWIAVSLDRYDYDKIDAQKRKRALAVRRMRVACRMLRARDAEKRTACAEGLALAA